MAKKSFNMENPAMQFISKPVEVVQEEPKTIALAQPEAPVGYKPNPLYVEKRSRRVQLLLQPSLHDRVKAKAERNGCSINDLIHSILEDATKGE